MTTTTTTTTTTMMATIDIPCSDGEVGVAAASEEDVGMATTQALTGSSFALGDRQDRVLTIDAGLLCTHWRTILRVCDLLVWIC